MLKKNNEINKMFKGVQHYASRADLDIKIDVWQKF